MEEEAGNGRSAISSRRGEAGLGVWRKGYSRERVTGHSAPCGFTAKGTSLAWLWSMTLPEGSSIGKGMRSPG